MGKLWGFSFLSMIPCTFRADMQVMNWRMDGGIGYSSTGTCSSGLKWADVEFGSHGYGARVTPRSCGTSAPFPLFLFLLLFLLLGWSFVRSSVIRLQGFHFVSIFLCFSF